MRLSTYAVPLLVLAFGIFAVIGNAQQTAAPLVNGMQAVTLTRTPTPGATKPEFTSVTLLPGRAALVLIGTDGALQASYNWPEK